MGRRENNKKVKKDQPSSEEELSEQEVEDQQQQDLEEDDEAEFYDEADQQIDGDQVILEKITKKIQQVDDDEKLSWAAIYHVKKQEAQLNEEMQKEIDAIKEKYEIQRIPLMHKISEAVSGKKLDKSVYSQNEHVKSINLNKTKPKALKDYWSKVFDGCGLIAHENDIDLLQKLTSFKVELLNASNQDIKLTFEFQDNEFFGNKIQIHVTGSVQQGNFVKKLDFTGKQKKVEENSLFGLLTGSQSDDQQLLDTCHDLYRAYVSSTYFYFYEPSDDLDEEGEDGQEDDEDSEDEDDEENVKAVQKPKGSAITQKPECKQQ